MTNHAQSSRRRHTYQLNSTPDWYPLSYPVGYLGKELPDNGSPNCQMSLREGAVSWHRSELVGRTPQLNLTQLKSGLIKNDSRWLKNIQT